MSKNPVLNTYNFVSTSNRQLQLDSNQYELIIRQQPKQARLCSSKERDRRPVDPPPIIQLKVNGYGDEAQNFLQSPYYFMCANLVHPTDSGESFTVSSRYLAGTVVSSLHKLKDVDNKDGGFFVFGDISVRVEGRYRLRFSLFEIIRDEVVHILSEISDVFTVYSPKAFPGMSESTFLSRSFSDQGVRIRIRKEHRIQMKRPQSNNNNNRQSDNAEGDDDDDGITDVPVKRKRSKSQLVPVSTFKSTPPLELFDTTSVSYPSQSQHSPYTSSSNSPYQQFHKFPSGQRHSSDRSLSYPPPLGGYPQHSPPQRQHSYYEDSEYEQSSQSSRNNDHTLSYYGYEYNEQSMLNKRPRLSNSEVTCYDYRQPLPLNYNTTNHHHYNSNMNVSHHHNHHNHHNPPPPPPPPPPHSSSSYRTPRRLSPLPENQPFYATSSTNTSSPHMFNHNNSSLPTRHHSFDTASSSNVTSLDSPFHYSVTAKSSSSTTIPQQPAHSQPIPPSDTFYRPSSSTQSFHPKPPVRSHTLPPYINRNHNDNDNDNLHHHHNSHHQDSTASLTSSNQLPTPKHSIDVDGLHNQNKKQLYSSYPPLTPPNPNSSSSVDSYKSGNNSNNSNSSSSSSSNNNLAPSFTQHFTSSPRTAPIPLPSKSPLLSNNNSISKTNSLPVMPSNSNINSSNTTTTFLSDGDVLTSSPQLLPTNNLPRLPPITSLTGSLDFIMNKKKDNYYNDSIQQQQQQQQSQEVTTQQYYHSHSIDDNLTYNNNNTWHNHGGGVNNGSNYGY